MDAYRNLLERAREVALLNATASLLSWDQELHLPPRGTVFRGDQLAYLGGRAHALWSAPETGDQIAAAADEAQPGSTAALNIDRWRYDYERACRIPVDLVEREARLCSEAHEAWKSARAANDFARFAGPLAALIEIAREKAALWGYRDRPYDALLEGYEPGLTTTHVRDLFDPLARRLSELCRAGGSNGAPLPPGPYPVEEQRRFNRRVVEALGFDFERGRIDSSVHPFSSSMGPHDNRITTRYDEADFTSSLTAALHEAGHGMYEQGLDPDAFGTPAGSSVSLGIHESQSRFWENQIGRSPAFWEFWYPVAVEHFPQLEGYGAAHLVAWLNRVEPSFIRVEAAEIGYDLHVVLRFEIEERLFNGDLEVEDIPGAWNERFAKLIGLEVPDDARGCLQDIHWSMGGFGYFPTYTLGSLTAAQLFEAVEQELGDLGDRLRGGDYTDILGFLRSRVHAHGRRFLPADLIREATGAEPSSKPFLRYAEGKVG